MAGDILDFNMSDGIAPLIMQKLNANFRNLRNLINDPEVVIASGATAPDPRTDETLWYNTETGELSIWAQVIDLETGEWTGEWEWRAINTNLVAFHDFSPMASMSEYYAPPEGQVFWYDTAHHQLSIWCQPPYSVEPRWESLENIIVWLVDYYYFRSSGGGHQRFVNAVRAAINE